MRSGGRNGELFPLRPSRPEANAAFRPTVSVSATPRSPVTRLVQIGIQGAVPDVATRPPLSLLFLIDTSGSMEAANKLPLLKQSFRLVKIQVEFNPAQVAEHRLIGYGTHSLRRADFNNDQVDAGNIGTGHSVSRRDSAADASGTESGA